MTRVADLTDAAFPAATARGITVVDFHAPWCPPCKLVTPILEALAAKLEGRASFYALDIDANPVTAARFRVMSAPTVIVFHDGVPAEVIVGARPRAAYERALEGALSPA